MFTQTGRLSLELNAHLSFVAPHDAAGSQELVDRDEEMEHVWNAGWAFQLQACAGRRDISNDAVGGGSAAK